MKATKQFYAQWLNDAPARRVDETPLHETLRWILRRINEGFVHPEETTPFLGIGREPGIEYLETGPEDIERRRMAVYISGLLAEARERGTTAQGVEASEEVRFSANEAGYLNTEFHYAMQLLDVLRDIRRRSFELVTLPLAGHASEEMRDLLQEATKAHLFGLHTASLALCRAALERALQEAMPATALDEEEQRWPKRGELEHLINAARARGVFDPYLTGMAHNLRKRANDVMHGKAVVDDSVISIGDTRTLIERLFAAKLAS